MKNIKKILLAVFLVFVLANLAWAAPGVTSPPGSATTVVDALTSTSSTSALSAGQGKVLNDGKVSGPASVTDGTMALFDSTTGKLIKQGGTPTPDNYTTGGAGRQMGNTTASGSGITVQ